MMLKTRDDLKLYRTQSQNKMKKEDCRILICAGTGCLAGGSGKIYKTLSEMSSEIEGVSLEFGPEAAHIGVHQSGCHGFCDMGPLVRIEPWNYLYIKV